jgi:hypothetical protein
MEQVSVSPPAAPFRSDALKARTYRLLHAALFVLSDPPKKYFYFSRISRRFGGRASARLYPAPIRFFSIRVSNILPAGHACSPLSALYSLLLYSLFPSE